jgi:hypothetical protein
MVLFIPSGVESELVHQKRFDKENTPRETK